MLQAERLLLAASLSGQDGGECDGLSADQHGKRLCFALAKQDSAGSLHSNCARRRFRFPVAEPPAGRLCQRFTASGSAAVAAFRHSASTERLKLLPKGLSAERRGNFIPEQMAPTRNCSGLPAALLAS